MSLQTRILLAATALAICLNACANPEAMPRDFRVEYSKSSGPVSPRYQYSESIEFGMAGHNVVTRSAFQTKSASFDVAPDVLENLAKRIEASMHEDWRVHSQIQRAPIGGPGCTLFVTLHGKRDRLPCTFWEIDPKYRDKQEQLTHDIEAVVPRDIAEDLVKFTSPPPEAPNK